MSAQAYFDAVAEGLARVRAQTDAIRQAAAALCDAVVEGRGIFSFGASHSFMLTEELVYRTGGLMLINPIYPHGMNLFVRPMTATSRLERVPGLGAASSPDRPRATATRFSSPRPPAATPSSSTSRRPRVSAGCAPSESPRSPTRPE